MFKLSVNVNTLLFAETLILVVVCPLVAFSIAAFIWAAILSFPVTPFICIQTLLPIKAPVAVPPPVSTSYLITFPSADVISKCPPSAGVPLTVIVPSPLVMPVKATLLIVPAVIAFVLFSPY